MWFIDCGRGGEAREEKGREEGMGGGEGREEGGVPRPF